MSPVQVLLPLDIIENIVNILIDEVEGLRYVKTLSLTCQSFLPFCRKHIFSSVEIKLKHNKPTTMYRINRLESPYAEAFEQLLLKTPAIAKYVRHLTLRISITKPHLARDPLDQVVRQLTRLQSLSISMYASPPDLSLNWNDISSSMKKFTSKSHTSSDSSRSVSGNHVQLPDLQSNRLHQSQIPSRRGSPYY